MRICFPVTEIFSYGVYGGFGSLTRSIAKGLAKRGHEVYAVTPRFEGQPPVDHSDGFTVLSYFRGVRHQYPSKYLYYNIEADVYHSEEPNIGSYLAEKARPESKHVITFQDPRTIQDHRQEWSGLTVTQRLRMELIIQGLTVIARRAVRAADYLGVQAWYAEEKARRIYKVKNRMVHFVPNPVEIPERILHKSEKPLVCFLARWDERKRVNWFFRLAEKFPDVEFICPGRSRFPAVDSTLRRKCEKIPNLFAPGFVSEKQKSEILEKSWVMVNTSWREGLPVAYLEATAHNCAILSYENPDNFASEFGYHTNGMFEDFVKGLQYLLSGDCWREKGENGRRYVEKNHEYNRVIQQHENIYKELLS